MIALRMLPRHVPGLRLEDVTRWVDLAWVRPEIGAEGWMFHDIDVARVRLIVELRDDLSLTEEAMPTVLSLLDQLYEARRRMLAIRQALDAVPPEARAAVLREPAGMTGDDAKPTLSKRGEADLVARREREAAALRANLRRRKEQQRGPGMAERPATETQEPDLS